MDTNVFKIDVRCNLKAKKRMSELVKIIVLVVFNIPASFSANLNQYSKIQKSSACIGSAGNYNAPLELTDNTHLRKAVSKNDSNQINNFNEKVSGKCSIH